MPIGGPKIFGEEIRVLFIISYALVYFWESQTEPKIKSGTENCGGGASLALESP